MAKLDILKLAVAILEDKVKALVGDVAIKELRKPLIEAELQSSLRAATKRAEQRFLDEYSDREICDLIRQMPLADLSSIEKVIRGFYDDPAAPVTLDAFHNQLAAVVPKGLEPGRIESAVASYMEILREELISIGALREKLNALANIETARNTARTNEELRQLKELVIKSLPTSGPISLTKQKALVAEELRDRIKRGEIFRNELHKLPPSSKNELYEKSEVWHRWRRSCEQTIAESFAPPKLLEWFPIPRHRDANLPRWEDRAKYLPEDYDKDLEYLNDLLKRLHIYE